MILNISQLNFKKIFGSIAVPAIAIFCFVFFALPAHATDQLTRDTSVSAPGSGNFTQWGGQYLGTGLNDTFSAVTIWGTFPGGAGLTLDICEATSEAGFAGMGSGVMACPTNKATGSLSEAKSNEEVVITLSQSVTLDPAKHYAIRLYLDQQSGAVIYGSADDGAYSGGTFGSYGYQTNFPQFFRTYTDPVKDIYFILGEPPPAYEIAFDNPGEAQELADFFTWDFNYTAPFGPLLSYGIEVYYSQETGVTSSNFDYYDVGGNLPGGELAEASIMKTRLLSLGDWYAKAYLIYNEEEVGYTDELSFTIVELPPESGAEEYGPPPEVSCSEGDFVCEIMDWFVGTISDVAKYLFIPSANSLNQFGLLWSGIASKAPIGYLSEIKDALAELTDGGEGAFEIDELEALGDTVGSLDTILGSILWFFLAFWLLRRIAKFEL